MNEYIIHKPKRPKTHYLAIILYALTPVINVLLVMADYDFFADLSLQFKEISSRFFDIFGITGGILMLIQPIIALMLLKPWKIAFGLFVIHSLTYIGDHVTRFISSSYMHPAAAISSVTILMILVLYFFTRDFRQPYLQKLQRYWRVNKRFTLEVPVDINGHQTVTANISRSGLAVAESPPEVIRPDEKVKIELRFGNHIIKCSGHVIRLSAFSYAIEFDRPHSLIHRLAREMTEVEEYQPA